MPSLSSIPPVVYQSVLPIMMMFALERITLFTLARTEKRKEWVRSKFWLHPNFISGCRFPMGFVSVILYHAGSVLYPDTPSNILHLLAILWFAFWMITDVTDGTIARLFDLGSEEGESIDPLSDKLLLFPPLIYFAILGFVPIYLVAIFLCFDLIGTISRVFITNKAANLFGKAKMFLATASLVFISIQQVYYPGNTWNVTIAMIICAVFLSFFSAFFKIIPNYWYANLLSLMNMVCGISGILLVLIFDMKAVAFTLVFLGQFLDLFDGRAADKWGSTPKGELLDDLADGTNFGGTISVIVIAGFDNLILGIPLAVIHFGSTVYRLYRFVKDKRKAGVKGGTLVFSGMPSPAGALFTGSVALLHLNDYIRAAFIILMALLMISKVPYIHFGRVLLPAIPKLVQVVLLAMVIMLVWFGFKPGNGQVLDWVVFSLSSAYLIFGYDWPVYHRKTHPSGQA